jgi:hypothetical protein
MYGSMNQRAVALDVWEQIAFPLRRRGDIIYRICAPREVLGGTPIVDAVATDEFIRGVSSATARYAQELARLRRRLRMWRLSGAVTGAVLVLLFVIRWGGGVLTWLLGPDAVAVITESIPTILSNVNLVLGILSAIIVTLFAVRSTVEKYRRRRGIEREGARGHEISRYPR